MLYLAMIEDAQERDKFQQIYDAYRQTMFHVAFDILKDAYLAEDAVHEAFLRIISVLPKINDVICPQTRAFIVVIIKNVAINMYNQRKKQSSISLDELEEFLPDDKLVDESYFETVGFELLVESIQQLPEIYKLPLYLIATQDLSIKEIAQTLKLSTEAVKKRLQRARPLLKKIIQKNNKEKKKHEKIRL